MKDELGLFKSLSRGSFCYHCSGAVKVDAFYA